MALRALAPAVVVALTLALVGCGSSNTRVAPAVTVRVGPSSVGVPASKDLMAPCHALPAVHLMRHGGGVLDVSRVEVRNVHIDYWDLTGQGQEIFNLRRQSGAWLLPPAHADSIVEVYVKWLAPDAGYGLTSSRFAFCAVPGSA